MAHWSVGEIRGPERHVGENGAPIVGLFFSVDIVGARNRKVEVYVDGYSVTALKRRVSDVDEVAREMVEQYLEKLLDEDSEPMGTLTLHEDQVMELYSSR
jgi:hypothetical protein